MRRKVIEGRYRPPVLPWLRDDAQGELRQRFGAARAGAPTWQQWLEAGLSTRYTELVRSAMDTFARVEGVWLVEPFYDARMIMAVAKHRPEGGLSQPRPGARGAVRRPAAAPGPVPIHQGALHRAVVGPARARLRHGLGRQRARRPARRSRQGPRRVGEGASERAFGRLPAPGLVLRATPFSERRWRRGRGRSPRPPAPSRAACGDAASARSSRSKMPCSGGRRNSPEYWCSVKQRETLLELDRRHFRHAVRAPLQHDDAA